MIPTNIISWKLSSIANSRNLHEVTDLVHDRVGSLDHAFQGTPFIFILAATEFFFGLDILDEVIERGPCRFPFHSSLKIFPGNEGCFRNKFESFSYIEDLDGGIHRGIRGSLGAAE